MIKKILLRVLLPFAMLTSSILHHRAGESQLNRMLQANVSRHGFNEHALPPYYAVQTFLDYGLNAPAWLVSVSLPHLPNGNQFSCCTFIKSDRDCVYLILVFVMWCCVGSGLEQLLSDAPVDPSVQKWRKLLARSIYALFGVFLVYAAVTYYRQPWNYPEWFVVPVGLWGMLLLLSSVNALFWGREGNGPRLIGMAAVIAGAFYWFAAIRLHQYQALFGTPVLVITALWSLIFMTVGICLILHKPLKGNSQQL